MRNVILDIEKILEDMKFKPSDARIYSLLLERGEMRVSEIAKELDLSARFVRDRLKDLRSKGIVKREMIEKGWIGYVYKAENPMNVLKRLKLKIIKDVLKRLKLKIIKEIEGLEKLIE